MEYPNALKDCLGNLSLRENLNTSLTHYQMQYYQGLIVGMVSALRFKGLTFDESISIIKESLPKDCIELNEYILPKDWIKEFI